VRNYAVLWSAHYPRKIACSKNRIIINLKIALPTGQE
jgi:hypothetical protein